MARLYGVDDSNWDEVVFINRYGLFMGYLMMGVRGLGLLVITWTTVVRLAGPISDLGNKDFWCLIGIMLIQTAGVFNFLLKEKISDTVNSWGGLLFSMFATFTKKDGDLGYKGLIMSSVLAAIQLLVFVVILCTLGVVYMLGMYISAGVSLWRLIEHDFGDAGGANQRPALQVLYILAAAQGVLFGYKTIYGHVAKSRLAKVLSARSPVDKGLIKKYIEDTVAGCEKNLSFASGRNFVTYGMDLMKEAKSSEDFIAGIKVLGGVIADEEAESSEDFIAKYLLTGSDSLSAIIQNEGLIAGIRVLSGTIKSEYAQGQKVLAKYLLTRSDSSSAIIQRLLETVGPRSPYSREIKVHLLRILDIIAHCIRLEQFPRAIECLCSVVDTSEESNQLQWNPEAVLNMFPNFEDIDTYAIRKKWKDAWCEKTKDYERLEVLEIYEKDYINNVLILIAPYDVLFRLEQRLYRCLPCGRPLIQRCLVGKRELEENKRKEFFTWTFNRLIVKAVNIIHKLVADEYNRWIMLHTCVSNTMLHKIAMFPTKLHRENHAFGVNVEQTSELQMLEQCWVLTEWLLVALRETSRQPVLPATPVGKNEEIEVALRTMDGSALGSSFKRTIKDGIESTIKCIFDCLDCSATHKRQAIQILLHLSLDMSFIVENNESRKRRFRWILLLILCSYDDTEYWMVPSLTYQNSNCCDFDGIRRLAGEKLSEMLREKHELPLEESEREVKSIHLALEDLKSGFYDGTQDISIRTHAIIIMEGLCLRVDYTRFSEVEGFLVDAIPEVVKEIKIRYESKTAEGQEQGIDVEKGNVSQDNQDGCKDSEQLLKALLLLSCAMTSEGLLEKYVRNKGRHLGIS